MDEISCNSCQGHRLQISMSFGEASALPQDDHHILSSRPRILDCLDCGESQEMIYQMTVKKKGQA